MEFICRNLFSAISCIFMSYSLPKLCPYEPKLWKKLIMYFIVYLTITIPVWVGDGNTILFFPFFMLACFICLSGEILSRLVIAGILYTVFMSINMLLESFYTDNMSMVIVFIVKGIVWYILAILFVRIAPKGGVRLSNHLCKLVGGLSLAPLMGLLSFSLWGNSFTTETEYKFLHAILKRMGLTVLPFIILSALSLLVAAVVFSRHEMLEQENRLASLREVYYSGLRQEQTQLRILRHDLRNHLTVLQGFLENSNNERAEQYILELCESPALNNGKRYSENEIANIVLSSKAAHMKEIGLVPEFSVQLSNNLPLSASELCALLGNALDNAIEAAVHATNKTIVLQTCLNKGVFILHVRNAINKPPNPDMSTTKNNTKIHGFGLTCMREIAQRYGGNLETKIDNGYFKLSVCFPCNNHLNSTDSQE